jgi:MFS family permease
MATSLSRTVYRNAAVLCLMIFLSDLRLGILSPTFSIYIVSLGGSVALVGVLAGLFSLTRLVFSIPAGFASDRWGRKTVLVGGLILLAGSTGAYGFVQDLSFLYPIRVVEGLGHCIIYTVGAAALSDSVPPIRRGTAIGVYMMAMGFGNSLGAVFGGTVADVLGFAPVFWIGALALLLGLIIVALVYQPADSPSVRLAAAQLDWGELRRWVFDRELLPANLGVFLTSMTYNSTIVSFFPLYAASVGVKGTMLGAMFGIRNLLSAVVRLPAGMQATPDRRRSLMLKAIALTMTAMWLVSLSGNPLRLAMLLGAEGLAFGTFITVGQAHANDRSEKQRGIILGIYAAFGSLGSTLGSFALGVLAQASGVSWVFPATGALLTAGLVIVWLAGKGQPISSSNRQEFVR